MRFPAIAAATAATLIITALFSATSFGKPVIDGSTPPGPPPDPPRFVKDVDEGPFPKMIEEIGNFSGGDQLVIVWYDREVGFTPETFTVSGGSVHIAFSSSHPNVLMGFDARVDAPWFGPGDENATHTTFPLPSPGRYEFEAFTMDDADATIETGFVGTMIVEPRPPVLEAGTYAVVLKDGPYDAFAGVIVNVFAREGGLRNVAVADDYLRFHHRVLVNSNGTEATFQARLLSETEAFDQERFMPGTSPLLTFRLERASEVLLTRSWVVNLATPDRSSLEIISWETAGVEQNDDESPTTWGLLKGQP
tara:strand:+ start:2992 stop:3912 length:921 start_codon:yes stop_codon:yes gene_type:complete